MGEFQRYDFNMSDQPKPATGHHPSCRESDKDLVWHCNQCGLNESAEPATGEWTVGMVKAMMLNWHGENDGYRIVAEKHNAALAAERVRQFMSDHQPVEELEQQLAAERERGNAYERQLIETGKQLAAEREAREIAERSAKAWEEDAHRYATNLDAERGLMAEDREMGAEKERERAGPK